MRNYDIDLPALPAMQERKSHPISDSQFTRRKLQGLLHIMTAKLKVRGTKTPHIFLPFRSRVDDTKITLFLRRVFPGGMMIDTSNKAIVRSVLDDFDEFTLICGLKYLWCRLPNNEIIGWKVYLEFKRKEMEAGYPKDAFLTIMPKCFSSSSHASIVYDFLDLMISVASNSQSNHLNGKKVAKMASIWAFHNEPGSQSAFFDATLESESSFLDGLDAWKKTCNGLFHLLLSFLRAMLPDTEAETLNLPKTLQSLLITSSYPPPDNTDSMNSVITIPCVHVRSTRKSSDPYELISKVRHSLSFEKKDAFLSIENFTILKNIFQKPSTAEIVATLSEESRRVLGRLTTDSVPSEFDLYPGWARLSNSSEDPNIPLYTEVSITSVTLQDYFIWTWLSSLGSDQNSSVKSMFGRSMVVEAGLRGFQKWMVLTETTISPEEYISKFQSTTPEKENSKSFAHLPDKSRAISPVKVASKKSHPHPPPPPPQISKTSRLPPKPSQSPLPDVNFENDQFSLEDRDLANFYPDNDLSPSSNYSNGLTRQFSEKLLVTQKKAVSRPRPPPLESPERETFERRGANNEFLADSRDGYDQSQVSPEGHRREIPSNNERSLHQQVMGDFYEEPFETYTTKFDRPPKDKSSEPFDNYEIQSMYQKDYLRSSDHEVNQNTSTEFKPEYVNHKRKDMSKSQTLKQSLNEHTELPPLPRDPEYASPPSNSVQISENMPRMVGDFEDRSFDPQANNARETSPSLMQNHSHVNHLLYPGGDNTGPDNRNDNPQPSPGYSDHSYSQQSDLTNPIMGSPEIEKRKKKKKSKKTSNGLKAMMADLPEGPPPPLPPMNETPVNSYPSNDGHYGAPGYAHQKEVPSIGVEGSRYEKHYDQSFPEKNDSMNHASHSTHSIPRENQRQELNVHGLPHRETPRKEEYYSPSPTHTTKKSRSSSGFSFESCHSSGQMPDREPVTRSANDASFEAPSVGHVTGPPPQLDGNYSRSHHRNHVSRSSHEDVRNYESMKDSSSEDYVTTTSSSRFPHFTQADKYNYSSHPNHGYENEGQVRHRYEAPSNDLDKGTDSNECHKRAHEEFQQPQEEVQEEVRSRSKHEYRAGHVDNAQQVYPQYQPVYQSNSSGMPPANEPYYPHQPPPSMAHPQSYESYQAHAPHQNRPAQTTRHHVPIHHPGQSPHNQPMPPSSMAPHQPQYYQPPPPPPQGYYPPPPQGHGYAPQPVMYYPPPGGSYAPNHTRRGAPHAKPKPSASELTMMNMPTANAFKKNAKPNKANLRAALNQGGFGI